MNDPTETPGEPSIEIAGLRIWVLGRERPDGDDRDRDWLVFSAVCASHASRVVVLREAGMEVGALAGWLDGCRALLGGRALEASLAHMEPYLGVTMTREDALGHIEMRVAITPDHQSEQHEFVFAIDQTYLPPLIAAIERTLASL